MAFTIRAYHPSDLPALYRICLLTGWNGADASHMYHDPDLLAHYYAGPYVVFEPDLCFVLTHNGTPCGYILGTQDSVVFHARCERTWFPLLRARYPLPQPSDTSADAQAIRLIHKGHPVNDDLAVYPAHLHIDLLPQAQGQGWGRKLVHMFLAHLRTLQVTGVHLGVGQANQGAIMFYERVGFQRVKEYEGWLAYGMRLT
jgi:ribosomal protein S18 acetylase RimI-like enzyme